MTPRQRAEAAYAEWPGDMVGHIEQAILAAVEAEREKIAQWADYAFGHSVHDVGTWIRNLEDRDGKYVATTPKAGGEK